MEKLKDVKERHAGEYVDIEYYFFIGSDRSLTENALRDLSVDLEHTITDNTHVVTYRLMDESAYQDAFPDYDVDFADLYGDENAKVLVIVLPKYRLYDKFNIIFFDELAEAKEYYLELADKYTGDDTEELEYFTSGLRHAESPDELCDVLNEYAHKFEIGTDYEVEPLH